MPLKGPVPAPLKAPADSGENARPVSARGGGLARGGASFKRKSSRKDKGSLQDDPDFKKAL